MKIVRMARLSVCVLLMARLLASCSSGTPSSTAEDETAIRRLLTTAQEATLRRDARLYATQFAEDADWENAFGDRITGRDSIVKNMEYVYKMFPQQSRFEIRDTRIRFITPEVAVADVERHITGQVNARGETLSPRRVRDTKIFRKTDGKWQVVLYRVGDLRSHQELQ